MNYRQSMRILTVSTLIFSSLTLSGCGKKSAPAPVAQAPEVGVIVVAPERAIISSELPGRTSPFQVSEVRPQVGGIIQKRLFTEGSDVKAGQILYQIDPASYQAAYASARATLAKAEANLTPARLKAKRYADLIKNRAVSQQENDDAQASMKQAEADVMSAKAALQTAKINLGYTRITAPVSGRIGRSSVTNGALVTASQTTALATIQQLTPIYVDISQSSAELLQLKQSIAKGQMKGKGAGQTKVKLLLEDGTPYPLEGSLKFSEITVDQSTGSVTLRTLFPNPKQVLLPGMFVKAIIEEGTIDQAILVPQRGVSRTPKGDATVMVVGADEKVEPRMIKVIRTIGNKWLVSDGLKAGDRVIVEGIQKARPGTPVKAVPFGSTATATPAAAAQPAATKK